MLRNSSRRRASGFT